MIFNKEFCSAIHEYINTILLNNDYKFHIKQSLINNNNCEILGLFANKEYKENDIMCQYVGEVLKTKEALHIKDKSYLMRLGEQKYINARESPHCLARYINDCRNPAGYNVKFVKSIEENCAWVVVIRDIVINEEIFVDYGKWYWNGSDIKPIRLSFQIIAKMRGLI